jgi:hypothetical protein
MQISRANTIQSLNGCKPDGVSQSTCQTAIRSKRATPVNSLLGNFKLNSRVTCAAHGIGQDLANFSGWFATSGFTG